MTDIHILGCSCEICLSTTQSPQSLPVEPPPTPAAIAEKIWNGLDEGLTQIDIARIIDKGMATETARANAAEATIKALREVLREAHEVMVMLLKEGSPGSWGINTIYRVNKLLVTIERTPACLATPNDKED